MEQVQNTQYATVRGFNYQPSFGSHGIETWGPSFNSKTIEQEIGRGKAHFPGINTLRLWLSYDAFLRYPNDVANRLESVLAIGPRFGVRFIPTLFNGWHSYPDFGGISVEMVEYFGSDERFHQTFDSYLESIVLPHADDDRILLWDLCNEPFNSCRCDASRNTVLKWLERVYRQCKDLGAKADIGVGSVPSMESARALEPISDVITYHPYYAWNAWVKSPEQFERNLDEAVAFANSVGKPFVATETGWGATEDLKRAEILEVELSALAQRRVGFTVHLLHHTLVADGHRPEYGPITNAGYMAFVEADGSLRPHHGIFNRF